MEKTPSPRLLEQVCAPRERAWLERQPRRTRAFTLLWCLKESRCKQSGQGLSFPISGIPVPLPEEGEQVLSLDGLYFSLSPGPDYALCLCASAPWGEGPTLVPFDLLKTSPLPG